MADSMRDSDAKPLDNNMPSPPASDGTATTQDNNMPSEPAEGTITTMDNNMPAPPALDLDRDGK
ncbi:hypothetical protein ACWC4E_11570 [Streptomyces sp. NPDC001273]|uniref:hypothetical protein n=1 Tax=unclassified Streptomyces TaxID=2593676 RepID=UPI0034012A84